MPRRVKCRKVCHYPQTLEFLPQNNNAELEPIVLTVDEYEAIRLIDRARYESGAVRGLYADCADYGAAHLRNGAQEAGGFCCGRTAAAY